MRTDKMFLATLLTCPAMLALQAPATAEQATTLEEKSASELRARDEATSRALLNGLLQRRFAIARSGDTKASRAAIVFVDQRIAQVIKRSAQQ
jgi:hypothetical protein